MPVAELKVGMRVVLNNSSEHEMGRFINDLKYVGTVCYCPVIDRFYMFSDERNGHFHSCGGNTPYGRGWWIKPHEVSLEGPRRCIRPKSGFGLFIERIENASI